MVYIFFDTNIAPKLKTLKFQGDKTPYFSSVKQFYIVGMQVFVTGASGFIGQAVVQELLNAGHNVVGLARSDKSAEFVKSLGAEVHRGSLEDLDSLGEGAAASDGVIHLAFNHDSSDVAGNCRKDQAAIETMGAALSDSN
jgi:NAD(P)-dependent dehydrogenase (short-subunit alcohol dehydrogenase family)